MSVSLRKMTFWLLTIAFLASIASMVLEPATKAAETTPSPSGISLNPASYVGQVGDNTTEDKVNDIIQIGSTMYAVGTFTSWNWNGSSYARKNVVAFSAVTGEPTAFAPQVDGEVLTVAASATGTLVYIGGKFTTVDGVARSNAAKLNSTSGALAAWNPAPNSTVQDIVLANGHLVVSGNFTTIGGASRTRWASLNQTTGVADSWLNIPLGGAKEGGSQKVLEFVPNPAGTYAVAIGNFYTVGGANHRRIVLIKIDGTKATVAPWNTTITNRECSAPFPTPENDVTWIPNGTSFVTVSTGGAHSNSICDSVVKWKFEPSNTKAVPTAINYTGGDTLSAVACTMDSCFVSGHQRWMSNKPVWPQVAVTPCDPNDAVIRTGNAGYGCKGPGALDRPGIAEIDSHTWATTGWNPTRSRESATHNSMLITTQGLWVGSDGAMAANQPHNDMVLFPFVTN